MNKVFEFESAVLVSTPVGPLQMNSSIIICKVTKTAAIFDGGGDIDRMLQIAAEHGGKIEKILQTHAHIDHVAALSELKEKTGAPIYLHADDKRIYDNATAHGLKYGFSIESLPPVDIELGEGDVIEVGDLKAEILSLPGHSPGSVVFHFRELQLAIVGDVLFAGSIGRVDLPLSDPAAMRASIARVKKLPPETLVIPGHGPETTIGMELKRNPFLNQDW